jgi:hypothetical protein
MGENRPTLRVIQMPIWKRMKERAIKRRAERFPQKRKRNGPPISSKRVDVVRRLVVVLEVLRNSPTHVP